MEDMASHWGEDVHSEKYGGETREKGKNTMGASSFETTDGRGQLQEIEPTNFGDQLQEIMMGPKVGSKDVLAITSGNNGGVQESQADVNVMDRA